MPLRRLIAFVGSATLAAGVFLPVVTGPMGASGPPTLFHGGTGDGIVLLVVAAACLFITYRGWYRRLLIPATLALAFVVFEFMRLRRLLDELWTDMYRDLEGNPFAGLGALMLSSIGYGAAWYVLALGVVLLFVAAGWTDLLQRTRHTETPAGAPDSPAVRESLEEHSANEPTDATEAVFEPAPAGVAAQLAPIPAARPSPFARYGVPIVFITFLAAGVVGATTMMRRENPTRPAATPPRPSAVATPTSPAARDPLPSESSLSPQSTVAPARARGEPAPSDATAATASPTPSSASTPAPQAGEPSAEPGAARALTFDGVGPSVSDETFLDPGLAVVRLELAVPSFGTVVLVDASGENVGSQLLLSDVSSGSTAIRVETAGRFRLKVDASAAWTAAVEQPSARLAPSLPYDFSGEGPQATGFVALSSGAAIVRLTLDDEGFASVTLLQADGTRLPSSLLLTSGTTGSTIVRIERPGLHLLTVDTSTNWTLRVE